jgi:hypothetical protein
MDPLKKKNNGEKQVNSIRIIDVKKTVSRKLSVNESVILSPEAFESCIDNQLIPNIITQYNLR